MRSSMAIMPLLAIALAVPAFAQQMNTVDQQTRQQVEAIVGQFIDALNKGDGRAIAAMYGPNPMAITPYGKSTSGEQIQTGIEAVHKRGLNLAAKIDNIEPLFGGQGVAVTAPYQGMFSNDPGSPHVEGNLLLVFAHVGDSWKIQISTASRLVPAPTR